MIKSALVAWIFFQSIYLKNQMLEDFWVIWNVGQGQWVTHIQPNDCLHFDVGGELGTLKYFKNRLTSLCSKKLNRLFLSHWDLDHFVHIPQLVKMFPHVCWQTRPTPEKMNSGINGILKIPIPYCTDFVTKLEPWIPQKVKSSNDASVVFLRGGLLLPGDSPKAQEKFWSQQMKTLSSTQVLILGHHGSRTSTSVQLLRKLPHLQLAIASARKARYGHPHIQTLLRLRKNKTPVLKTEDWGSIWIL